MNSKSIALAFASVLAFARAASAATTNFTVGFTEGGGNRPLVDGTTLLADAPTPDASVSLGSIGMGDVVGLYGRIVSAVDNYMFGFSSDGSVAVSFDFDGYFVGGNPVENSGLVSETGFTPGKDVTFTLMDALMNVIATRTFTSNYTASTPGADPYIFGAIGGGDYFLSVDGNGTNSAARYDLAISAVPVPAALPLLLTGIAGLGFMSRRKRAAA